MKRAAQCKEESINTIESIYNPIPQELRDQEKHIEQLRGAVRAKGQPLKVAQVHMLLLAPSGALIAIPTYY